MVQTIGGPEGRVVRLEPLAMEHLPRLVAVGLEPALWRWTLSKVSTADHMRRYVETALGEARSGVSIPYATIWRATGEVIGSSRLMNLAPEHRRAEIGSTRVAPPWQRTAANTEAKLLMLGSAFGPLNCRRVEFKTNTLNAASRQALLRLGATEEGTLRQHMTAEDGVTRDTVYYSILENEWPAVQKRLQEKLRSFGFRVPSSE